MRNGNHYISRGKHDFIAVSMNRLKTHPIIKMKGRVELNQESIALVEVQAPRDIMGNRKYQLNPAGYLPQGIIPLDLVHSFDKMPRSLFVPILNTSSKYESIAKGANSLKLVFSSSYAGCFCLVCWFSCSFVSEACACFGEWLQEVLRVETFVRVLRSSRVNLK